MCFATCKQAIFFCTKASQISLFFFLFLAFWSDLHKPHLRHSIKCRKGPLPTAIQIIKENAFFPHSVVSHKKISRKKTKQNKKNIMWKEIF